jgi:hypothetical protein
VEHLKGSVWGLSNWDNHGTADPFHGKIRRCGSASAEYQLRQDGEVLGSARMRLNRCIDMGRDDNESHHQDDCGQSTIGPTEQPEAFVIGHNSRPEFLPPRGAETLPGLTDIVRYLQASKRLPATKSRSLWPSRYGDFIIQ